MRGKIDRGGSKRLTPSSQKKIVYAECTWDIFILILYTSKYNKPKRQHDKNNMPKTTSLLQHPYKGIPKDLSFHAPPGCIFIMPIHPKVQNLNPSFHAPQGFVCLSCPSIQKSKTLIQVSMHHKVLYVYHAHPSQTLMT